MSDGCFKRSLITWPVFSGLQRVLRVDEVRGQLTFALDVDHSSQSDIIAQRLSHMCGFLRYLRRQQTTH